MTTPIVLIRQYKREDDPEVQGVLYEGTTAPINEFFIQSLTREMFFQAIVMVAAIIFVFFRAHFYWVAISIPLVLILNYLIIWFAHYYKAKYLQPDMLNIQKNYLYSDKTNFFVAEVFYTEKNKDKPPVFINAEFDKIAGQFEYTRSRVIGTIAIMRDKDLALTAWLRRMAVKKEWRGKKVGSHLLERTIKFCSQKGFVAIELMTTECHSSAKNLYLKKGFEVKQFYHKKFFNLSGLAITMYLMHFKTRPYKETLMNI